MMKSKKQMDSFKEEPKKKVAVLFSSGLDSTYLVWKNLEEGNAVIPIYVEIKNNENKTKIEKQNVEMLCEMFREKYGCGKMHHLCNVTEVSIINDNRDLLFTQLPIWIFSLVYLPMQRIDEIQIGYVMNDDAVSYIDEIKKFYKAHAWLQDVRQPKLVFPLIKEWKQKMLQDLPHEYREYVTSCENPQLLPYYMHVKGENVPKRLQFYKPCGDCVPCRRIIKDNLGYNTIYSQMIKDHRDKINLGEELFILKKEMPERFSVVKKMIDHSYHKHKPMPLLDSSYIKSSDDDSKIAVS